MKVFKTNIACIGKQESLRLDVKYRAFYDVNKGKLCNNDNVIKIGDLIKILPCKKLKKGELENKCNIIDISEIEDNTATIEEIVQGVDCIGSDKNILNGADIMISKIVMSKGYVFVNKDTVESLIGSSEIIPYIKRDKNIDIDFLKYVLVLKEMLQIYTCLETGKTPSQKRVNPRELLEIRIPFVPYSKQKEIGDRIREIEKNNVKLRTQVSDFNQKIDEIFLKELYVDKNELVLLPIYNKKNWEIGKDFDLRMSYKYNNSIFGKSFFKGRETFEFRQILFEPMKMGKSISPDLYDEDGEAKYIAMSSIKKWGVDYEESKSVSAEYYLANKSFSKIEKDDILLARSGEGTIGKVALVSGKEKAVCADFIIRIRLKKSVNVEYMYYYMRSCLFQIFIFREKKGLGNNTNIFPKQINRIPIIKVSPEMQNKILTKILSEKHRILDVQKKLDENKSRMTNMTWESFCEK